MSHANGIVFDFDGKPIGYFEYNGTADICCPTVRNTPDDVRKYWRQPDSAACVCDRKSHKDVQLYTDYGGGFHWPGVICTKCNVIVTGFNPTNGKPPSPQQDIIQAFRELRDEEAHRRETMKRMRDELNDVQQQLKTLARQVAELRANAGTHLSGGLP